MIDLSKIQARELPTKTVNVNILGHVQQQEIRPLQGEDRIRSWSLDYARNAAESTVERVKITLTSGARLTPEIADKLIALDWDAAVNLAGEVLRFTDEFEKAIAEEKSSAEKNSPAEAGTDTPVSSGNASTPEATRS